MDVESFEEGYLAKIIFGDGASAPVGSTVALLAKTQEDIPAVQAMTPGAAPAAAAPAPAAAAPAAAPASSGTYVCVYKYPFIPMYTTDTSSNGCSSLAREKRI